jgi:hypothetical protein
MISSSSIASTEIADVIRAGIRGDLTVKRLFDTNINDCTSGDMFDFQIGDYVFVGFVDDPGAIDYLDEVRCGDRVVSLRRWWGGVRVSDPIDLLTDAEQDQFDDLLDRL